jgi:hypothetical protein
LYVSYAVTSRTVGYAEGAVWLDTVSGATGTESYVYGTADKPVKTIGEALTIAAAVGLRRIRVINGSSVTLGATMTNYSMVGKNWTLALGGQSIAGLYVDGATVSGTSSGAGAAFSDCTIGTATIDSATLKWCKMTGTLTTVASGSYSLIRSYDGTPGTASNPIIILAANVGVGIRDWAGGLQLNAFAATNEVAIDGSGRIILHTDCAGAGTLILRGPFKLTDNVSGGWTGTVTNTEQLGLTAAKVGTVLTSGGNNTASSFYTDLPGGNDYWKDCLLLITSGALLGQVKEIGGFTDTNGVVTLTNGQAFTATPADGVTFAIINR